MEDIASNLKYAGSPDLHRLYLMRKLVHSELSCYHFIVEYGRKFVFNSIPLPMKEITQNIEDDRCLNGGNKWSYISRCCNCAIWGEKVKIVHILIGGNIGGIEVLCKDYAQYSMHDNTMLLLWGDGPLVDEMKENGVKVINLQASSKNIHSTINKMLKFCKDNNIDVVIAHHAAPMSHLCLLAIKMKMPKVITVAYAHSNAMDMCRVKEKKRLWLRTWILRKSFQSADCIISISESVKKSLLKIFDISNNRIDVIYNGVDTKSFVMQQHKTNDPLKLIYVGRLIDEKGVQVILNGLFLLPAEINYNFVVIGDGPYKNELENIAKKYGVEKNIKFLGSRRDVPKLLSQADIFVHLPILEEGFGIAVVEAMAAGLVCICAKSGAIPEIIKNDKNGFLVEKENPSQFSLKLQEVIKNFNTNDMKNIKKAAIIESKKFTIEIFANKLDKILINKTDI